MKQVAFFFILSVLISCKKDKEEESLIYELPGIWEKTAAIFPIPTGDLMNPISSYLNDAYYVVGVYDSPTFSPKLSNVFYKFTPTWGWEVLSPFPGAVRIGAVSFTLNGKIYIGLGKGYAFNNRELLNDFWVYSPTTDSWDLLSTPFPAKGREYAISFVCDGKAYVGTGNSEYVCGDFYSFTPEDGWKQENDMSITPRWGAVSFELDQQIYVATGYENTIPGGAPFFGVNKFSTSDKKWEKMKSLNPIDYPDFALGRGTGVVLNEAGKDFGYIIGKNPDRYLRYDPRKDRWYSVNNMQSYALYFTINNTLYGIRGINTYRLTN